MEILKLGSKGADVKVLQYDLNLIADGIFGPLTQEAVKQFQKEHGLIADGIVGPSTWDKLGHTKRVVNEIILHCSATPEGKDYTINQIKTWHLQRGFSDIGYHYIIYRDGTINAGRDIDIVGAHCTNHNSHSIGICYIGGCTPDGKTSKDTRTDAQKASLVKLVKELMVKYHLTASSVHCHNEYAAKACPSFKIESFRKEL